MEVVDSQHCGCTKCYQIVHFKMVTLGTSLVVKWLRLHTSNAGAAGSIPGRGTKIPHALRHGQKNKIKKIK